MADLFDYTDRKDTSAASLPPAPPVIVEPTQPPTQVDPKLLTKALKKIQGLVKGNGMRASDVTLGAEPGDIAVRIYRFKARTFLKLVPEYGIKAEPGRNTKAELMQNQTEFNGALSRIVTEARTLPEKRKQIVDFMFGRSDKGFGIKEQRIKFHMLSRDFVQHEKCQTCKNTGKTACSKCQGHGITPCANCQGRRQVVCPRCRGTAKVHMNNKVVPCQYCREDGKINCPKCAGRGQNKCNICASSGALQCQPCAGTGWLSQLAHIEIFAQIFFAFDRDGMPEHLASLIERAPARLVEKNDVEVSLKEGWIQSPSAAPIATTTHKKPETALEPEDTIWLDYDVTIPYGPLSFNLKDKKIAATLFGYQARILDGPAFLDDLTRIGQQALLEAASGRGSVVDMLRKAAKYALLREVITQTLRIKNHQKTQIFLAGKYSAGIRGERFEELIAAADIALRHITRKWRNLGMATGTLFFSLLPAWYFLLEGRPFLFSRGLPEIALGTIDLLFIPLGTAIGILSSKFAAKLSLEKTLQGIIAPEILGSALPKAGKTAWWALASATLVVILCLITLFLSPGENKPAWMATLSQTSQK